jgi:hypothetical protein
MTPRSLVFIVPLAWVVGGCGLFQINNDQPKPNYAVAPQQAPINKPAPFQQAVAVPDSGVHRVQLAPIATIPRPLPPQPRVPIALPPPEHTSSAQTATDNGPEIPVNVVGVWQDERTATLTFTEDGRFEVDALNPNDGSTVRASGVYTHEGKTVTLNYRDINIDTADPKFIGKQQELRDEFLKKGPGATPQVEKVEMKSKDEFVMTLTNPGSPLTVNRLKRKA